MTAPWCRRHPNRDLTVPPETSCWRCWSIWNYRNTRANQKIHEPGKRPVPKLKEAA